MPFDRLFRQAQEEEDAATEQWVLEKQKEIVTLRQELEVFETPAWKRVDDVLAEKLGRHMRDMMVGDPEQMVLARERARVVADLRAEPELVREKIADLQKQVAEVEGAE